MHFEYIRNILELTTLWSSSCILLNNMTMIIAGSLILVREPFLEE